MSRESRIEEFVKARDAAGKLELRMACCFVHFRKLLKAGKIEEAKEYLRPMPYCATKVLFFREIIVVEENVLRGDA